MPAAKKKKSYISLLYITASAFLLFLSFLNIQRLNIKPDVLGAEVEIDYSEVYKNIEFWEKLVAEHPTYYDGWIELYKLHLTLDNKDEANYALEVAKRIDFNR